MRKKKKKKKKRVKKPTPKLEVNLPDDDHLEERNLIFHFGSLPDIFFISHKDQRDWIDVPMIDFYVTIQDRVSFNFRMAKQAPFSLNPADVVIFLQSLPDVQDIVSPVLYFKDMEVPADTDLVKLALTKPTFILAEAGSNIKHSGKLFTCGGEYCIDPDGYPMGWTKLANFRSHRRKRRNKRGDCVLLDEALLLEPIGKRGWGNLPDYDGGNPHGCPTDMKQVRYRPAAADLPPVEIEVIPTASSEEDDPEEVPGQPGQRVTRQMSRDRKRKERKKKKKKQTSREDPLPSLIDTSTVAQNAKNRRVTMADQLESLPTDTRFMPDVQDLDFERQFIKAPCMTACRKFQRARADLSQLRPESLEAIQKGQLPDYKTDADYVSETYKGTLRGARLLMTVLQKHLNLKQIHYRMFLDFESVDLIRPMNVIDLLDRELKTGNDKVYALKAYKMILTTQSEESRKSELSFSKYITEKKKEDLTPLQLQNKCRQHAESFRSSVTNALTEMDKQKPHKEFRDQQKVQAEVNVDLKTKLVGPQVPDASKVLPQYFSNKWVCEQETKLLACASDSNKVPQGREMKDFTNLLMVRLMLKGTHRKEILTKLQRKNFIEALGEGLLVGNYCHVDPEEEAAEGVFVLDNEKGGAEKFRLELGPASGSGQNPQPNQRRSRKQKEEEESLRAASEGICIKRNLHKTFQKGDAFLWLSLPDVVLMDSYQAIAIRYCREHGYSYELDDRFFFTPRGKEVVDIDFAAFSQITGRELYY